MLSLSLGIRQQSFALTKTQRQPTPVFLPGEFHGQRSLAGYIPWGCKESNTTEGLSLTHMYNFIYFWLS